jgi:hypothetical protein
MMIGLLGTALLFRVRPLARSGPLDTVWLSGVLLPGRTALERDA